MMIAISTSASAVVEPRYSDGSTIYLTLTFSSGSATCGGRIIGAIGTTSIKNCTIILTDNNGDEKGKWENLSAEGNVLPFSKTATGIKVGVKYTLTVSADIICNGKTEHIYDSITKTY